MATDALPPPVPLHAVPVVRQIKWANICTGRTVCPPRIETMANTTKRTRTRGELQKLSFSVPDQKCAAGEEGGSTHIGAPRLEWLGKFLRLPTSLKVTPPERMPSVRASEEAFMMTFHRFSNQEKLIHRPHPPPWPPSRSLTYSALSK